MRHKRSVVKPAQPQSPRRLSGRAVMQPSVTAALTKALFLEWAQAGYGALSLEAVAKRAGVGKAALYRRWPSKLAMVTDCLEQIDADLSEIPDTGSLIGDVRALLASLRQLLGHRLVRGILPDLHAEMIRSPELAAAIRGRLQVKRRARGSIILCRAIACGEISAGIDTELALDALGGMIYWRMIITGETSDDQYLDNLTSFFVRGLSSK